MLTVTGALRLQGPFIHASIPHRAIETKISDLASWTFESGVAEQRVLCLRELRIAVEDSSQLLMEPAFCPGGRYAQSVRAVTGGSSAARGIEKITHGARVEEILTNARLDFTQHE